jgi:hypothetical protein
MARHGTLYRVFFPRNSYDASLSIVGAWLWLSLLLIVGLALLWAGGNTGIVVVVGAAIVMATALFELGMYAVSTHLGSLPGHKLTQFRSFWAHFSLLLLYFPQQYNLSAVASLWHLF